MGYLRTVDKKRGFNLMPKLDRKLAIQLVKGILVYALIFCLIWSFTQPNFGLVEHRQHDIVLGDEPTFLRLSSDKLMVLHIGIEVNGSEGIDVFVVDQQGHTDYQDGGVAYRYLSISNVTVIETNITLPQDGEWYVYILNTNSTRPKNVHILVETYRLQTEPYRELLAALLSLSILCIVMGFYFTHSAKDSRRTESWSEIRS